MTDAGEWLLSTAKRNPEALLVLAAGCALLMRSRGSFSQAPVQGAGGVSSSAPWGVSRATEKASAVATDLKDRIVEAGSSVTEQAGEMAKTVSAQTTQIATQAQSMVSTGFGHLLREQPLVLVALGLAAGAAAAVLLPATEMEERTLGGARDAISGIAGKVGDNLIAAATDAGQRLTQGVTERAVEGLKELAQDVAGQFADRVIGATDKPGEGASNVTTPSNRKT
jgi:hypothetical protein